MLTTARLFFELQPDFDRQWKLEPVAALQPPEYAFVRLHLADYPVDVVQLR